MEMDFDCEKKHSIDINGFIEAGKQFDLDINLEEDNRNVIYGIIKNSCNEPINDAVVKLIEVTKYERKPITHTFTDKDGEFVFGPLCPDKKYAIDIWANRVDHIKICKSIKKDGKCLKGIDMCCNTCSEDEYININECENECKDN